MSAPRGYMRRSRGGCSTCRRLHRKCDETKPTCARCQQHKRLCEGYSINFVWKASEIKTPSQPRWTGALHGDESGPDPPQPSHCDNIETPSPMDLASPLISESSLMSGICDISYKQAGGASSTVVDNALSTKLLNDCEFDSQADAPLLVSPSQTLD